MKSLMYSLKKSLIFLPTPSNISLWWNLGFMLGMTLILQISTGLFLALHYHSHTNLAFNSLWHIIHNVNYGWILQITHSNGASLFFILIYLHLARGIYYSSYKKISTWISGFSILMILMLSAFLGYVLPWGQMSFWGATVITNLLSALPYLGKTLVFWLWGGFSVEMATLSRFFIFHFLLPLMLIILVLIHLICLHEKGSNNPLGTNSNFDKIPFFSYFWVKDLMTWTMVFMMFSYVCFFYPFMFNDTDNFIPANPLITPIHIQPEWYFLFAYAILRSIPNKLGGVLALLLSLLILLMLPLFSKNLLSKTFSSSKIFFWLWVNSWIILTFLGAKPVEEPFFQMGQMISMLYFSFALLL